MLYRILRLIHTVPEMESSTICLRSKIGRNPAPINGEGYQKRVQAKRATAEQGRQIFNPRQALRPLLRRDHQMTRSSCSVTQFAVFSGTDKGQFIAILSPFFIVPTISSSTYHRRFPAIRGNKSSRPIVTGCVTESSPSHSTAKMSIPLTSSPRPLSPT